MPVNTPHNQDGNALECLAPLKPVKSGQCIIQHFQTEKDLGFIALFGERDVLFHVTELVDGKLAVEIGQKVCFDLEQNPKDPGAFVTVRVHLYDFEKSEVEGGRIDDG